MDEDRIPLAVFGLHLCGQPLNHQLLDLGATFVRTGKTAPTYRLYAIHGRGPAKPGAILVNDGSGAAIDLEIWSIPVDKLGHFVRMIPPPLGIGTVRLDDGSEVKGFICEGYVAEETEEITGFGGWLAYQESRKG
jgi:allophanate hydrolase